MPGPGQQAMPQNEAPYPIELDAFDDPDWSYLRRSGWGRREDEPHVIKIGKEPKTFTFKIEDEEQLSLKMTQLEGCKVSVEILKRNNVTGTRPLTWPAFFEPGATFAIGVHAPRHRQEVRGSVSGTGACRPQQG